LAHTEEVVFIVFDCASCETAEISTFDCRGYMTSEGRHDNGGYFANASDRLRKAGWRLCKWKLYRYTITSCIEWCQIADCDLSTLSTGCSIKPQRLQPCYIVARVQNRDVALGRKGTSTALIYSLSSMTTSDTSPQLATF
jgi:hypothetical protein